MWLEKIESDRLNIVLILILGVAFLLSNSIAGSQKTPPVGSPANDLDAFMAKVLQKRAIDKDRLHDYICSEEEEFEIKGEQIAALENFRREYIWFVRDGNLVRSPVRFNGVKVSAEEQKAAEDEWIKDQKQGKLGYNLDRESFFGFKFEPGRYLYGGEQQFEGRKVLVIDYCPQIDKNHKPEIKDKIANALEKSILVTMLIIPEEHQIVKMTFDNVTLDFLPARWLMRLNDIKASLVMDKPLGDVWLPREVSAYGSFSTANIDLAVKYSRQFFSYHKTDVKVKFWVEPDNKTTTKE
jgi:hypothetical protein